MVWLSRGKLLSMFLTGKLLRFVFFVVFLFFLLQGSKTLAGYNQNQIIFFFLSFNVVDILGQFLFRSVYTFRGQIVSGDFDLILEKPANPLFRALFGGADIIDLITVPPLVFAVFWVGRMLNPAPVSVVYYLTLLVNGLLISCAFHIAVLAFGIITLEIDHTVMIFRDLQSLGKLPIDIYKQPLQGVLTYLIPIGIMVTLPAKALMGLVSFWGVVGASMVGIAALLISIQFWNFALTKYTSASS